MVDLLYGAHTSWEQSPHSEQSTRETSPKTFYGNAGYRLLAVTTGRFRPTIPHYARCFTEIILYGVTDRSSEAQRSTNASQIMRRLPGYPARTAFLKAAK